MKRTRQLNLFNEDESIHISKQIKNESIYLDYNATTPLDDVVLNSINIALRDAWGNPSSSYEEGKIAKSLIDEARTNIATMVRGSPSDVIFTSGGTEANNLVFHTMIEEFSKHAENRTSKPHFITSNIEHDSVLYPLKHLNEIDKADLTIVPVSKISGKVEPASIMDAITDHTCLISIMMANNETGTIQPVGEICQHLKYNKYNETRSLPIKIHTDAAQAIGKIDVNVDTLGIDYLTIVGHKFYGPRIGAIYVKDLHIRNTIHPIFYGGGQEQGIRPGTENTGMIYGLGKAARLVCENLAKDHKSMLDVRDYLENKLTDVFGSENLTFNGKFADSDRLPNTCNFSFRRKDLEGYKLLNLMSKIRASTGAACHSNSSKKCSPILLAFGIPVDIACNALRISVGKYTGEEEIDLFIEYLKSAVSFLLINSMKANSMAPLLDQSKHNTNSYYKDLFKIIS